MFHLMFTDVLISLIFVSTMSGSIKLFKFLQNSYQTIGIYQPSESYQNRSLNSKNVFFIFCMTKFGTSVGIFFLFEAKQLDEYCLTFFCALSTIAAVFYLISNLYQIENISKLIATFEEMIALSK